MKQSILVLSALAAFTTADVPGLTRRTTICGSRGYDTDHEGYYYGNQGTYDGCSAQCLKDNNCKSFSFGNGECNLYTVAVSGNFAGVFGSPFTFYDVSCVSATSTTSGKVSSTSTTATIKSSTTSVGKISTTTIRSSTTSTKTTSKSTTSMAKTTTKATTTTTKRATSTKTTSSSTSTTASMTDPPCPLPTFVVTNFKYFNSSHNADCADGRPDVGDGTGCLDSNGNWCDPNVDAACAANNHCNIGVCMTGLGTQPVGYGPPDTVSADISNIGSCYESNPGTTPLRPISGGNVVRCSGSSIQWVFDGDSTKANSIAYFNLQNQIFCPDGSYFTAYGQGQTAMSCSYDSGNNATCVLNDPSFGVPATSFAYAYYASGQGAGSN